MSEFVPAKFVDLLHQLYCEVQTNDSLFTLPRRKWYVPAADDPDLSVDFHGRLAGNPVGPAAGPHTQLAQNLLLSYVAGGRVLELKTVQVNDHLSIPRPCIDMATVGFNVEWSQELPLEQTQQQYIAGWMLIEIFRRDPAFVGQSLAGKTGEVIFDMSVGYSLDGIRSEPIQRFLDAMRDARSEVESLRQTIPDEYRLARELSFPTQISSTVTLSTFHGCPPTEIERICEFLLAERDVDVIVKMNPSMLGQERVEHLLHDVMGYHELNVMPSAYTSGVDFDEAVAMVNRLSDFARQRGRRLGCKFGNTLEVLNDGRLFSTDNKVQYLSGAPLHVITMTLTDLFRRMVGAAMPISFSAGIDAKNFPAAVACGFIPVTTCTDLLKPGGYGRLAPYLRSLTTAMRDVKASDIDEFILKSAGENDDLSTASLANTSRAAEAARQDVRYRESHNSRPPKRVDSELATFDCLACDKCIPVCPNAANFVYHTQPTSFDYHDCLIEPNGSWSIDAEAKRFTIEQPCQIANFADFCNACGNCDTFCPEYGGPFIRKPQFYGRLETWTRMRPRDGFAISKDKTSTTIHGRIHGKEFSLAVDAAGNMQFCDEGVVINCTGGSPEILSVQPTRPLSQLHRVDVGVLHMLRILHQGVLDGGHVNPVNVRARRPAKPVA